MKMHLKTVSAICAACLIFSGCGKTQPEKKPDPVYDTVLNDRLLPVWEDGGTAIDETAFIIANKDGTIDPVSLAYPIDEIVSVRDFSLKNTFTEMIDYTVENGKLLVKETGHIPFIAYDEFYFEESVMAPTDSALPEADGSGSQLFTEAQMINGVPQAGLTQWQIAVTYKHSAEWDGYVPEDKSEKFPKLHQRLASGEQVNLVCLGDSISAGWTASGYGYVFLEPYCPPYFDLVTDYIRARYGKVQAKNYSVGGMNSQWGAADQQIADVVSQSPDLLVLAFGMNDGSGSGSIPTATFQANIKYIIEKVRESVPECEVVLVSTMLPNAQVGFTLGDSVLNRQDDYLAALKTIEDEFAGVAVANITSVHEHLLSIKKFQDMSTNNINHPNDYIHRIYAQTVLTTLFGTIERVEVSEESL